MTKEQLINPFDTEFEILYPGDIKYIKYQEKIATLDEAIRKCDELLGCCLQPWEYGFTNWLIAWRASLEQLRVAKEFRQKRK